MVARVLAGVVCVIHRGRFTMFQTYRCISLIALLLVIYSGVHAQTKPKIAVFSGPSATVQNTVPLVTSNKAREKYGLAPMTNPDGSVYKFDHLAPQRLAAPVEVYIEQFSAHPLESDAAELYGAPDGYLDKDGNFHEQRQSDSDKAVYKVTLKPEDGLYNLPYMSRQADGSAWEGDCAQPYAPDDQCRQPFFPDPSWIFEETDRGIWGLDDFGRGNPLTAKADFDFYRGLPSGGYKKGQTAGERTDVGDGDIAPEVRGRDFFAYRPWHLLSSTRRVDLALLTNRLQTAFDSGEYQGAIWLEGSPTIEENVYWMNLLLDTTKPMVANAAQRTNRSLSSEGPRNIVDSVNYIVSEVWADDQGRDQIGAVMIQDEQIFASRQVQKSDARPGGFIATGDHGGILGTMGVPGPVEIYFRPQKRHTWKSDVRITSLPDVVKGVTQGNRRAKLIDVRTKDTDGKLLGESIPSVTIVKMGEYGQDGGQPGPDEEPDILARIDWNLKNRPLSGFVGEGLSPYGVVEKSQELALEVAAFSGMPVVYVGRGNAGGLTETLTFNVAIEGNNLTATKARMLLRASLLKLGAMPPARDPRNPTAAERQAAQEMVARYQKIFDTH